MDNSSRLKHAERCLRKLTLCYGCAVRRRCPRARTREHDPHKVSRPSKKLKCPSLWAARHWPRKGLEIATLADTHPPETATRLCRGEKEIIHRFFLEMKPFEHPVDEMQHRYHRLVASTRQYLVPRAVIERAFSLLSRVPIATFVQNTYQRKDGLGKHTTMRPSAVPCTFFRSEGTICVQWRLRLPHHAARSTSYD